MQRSTVTERSRRSSSRAIPAIVPPQPGAALLHPRDLMSRTPCSHHLVLVVVKSGHHDHAQVTMRRQRLSVFSIWEKGTMAPTLICMETYFST